MGFQIRTCTQKLKTNMIVTAAEGYRCKDSQDLNIRHVKENVNLHSITVCDEEEGFDNIKAKRRSDFKGLKKNKLRDRKAKKYIIKPHSTSSIYTDLVSKLGLIDTNTATEMFETIFVAFLLKIRKSTVERALIITAKLLRVHLGIKYSDIINKVLLCKDLKFVSKILSWNLEKVEEYVKDLLSNWKLASKNEAFGCIISLFSTFLAVFYSADKKWNITIGSFSLFLLDARNACKGATGLIDAFLKISTYVLGGLKKFVNTGSISGFLYADDQLAEFDSLVSSLVSRYKLIAPGNLEKHSHVNENAFDQDLQSAIGAGEKLILLYDGNTKKYVMDKVRLLKQTHVDFIQIRSSGGLRVAPFAYLLAGSTGLGKSSINEILMRYILSANGFNHEDNYICTLNSQDKYFSTYRSYINGVIFDDFANVSKDFVQESPCETLLKFVNNIPYYLNMAELELKGKVVAEPKVVGITTNVQDIDSSVYSNQASSIMRRMKVHIYASVKEEFRKKDTVEIDSSKVQAVYGENVLAPDIWSFDVYVVKVEAIPRPPKTDCQDVYAHRDDRWKLVPVKWNGSDMLGATISELLVYMKEASAIHYKEQNNLIERGKLFNNRITCEVCNNFFEHCSCVTLSEAGCSISDLQSVISELDSCDPMYTFIGSGIYPHSTQSLNGESTTSDDNSVPCSDIIPDKGPSGFFKKHIEVRNQPLEAGLKAMLLSWIAEGKCNLESFTENFMKNCSKELQYFFIVIRKMAEKWFDANKKFIVEMCFPKELEDSQIGDCYSRIMRVKELKYISYASLGIEWAMRISLFGLTLRAVHEGSQIGTCLPLLGHIFISHMDTTLMVTKTYDDIIYYYRKYKEVAQKKDWDTISNVSMVAMSAGALYTPLMSHPVGKYATVGLMTMGPIYRSYLRVTQFEAPRALSLLYKSKKDEFNSDWNKIAPAAMTAFSLYNSKQDIVDFYVNAWETWYMSPHSQLKPNVEEIEKRDKKHRFDEEWFRTQSQSFLDPLPTSTLRTPNEVREAISESVWFVKNLNTTSKSNCFVLCSGFILIPWHYIPKSPCKMQFVKHNRGNKGNRCFESVVEPSQCVRVSNSDLALMWMPKTRDCRNLIDCFPVGFDTSGDERTGKIATRDEDGNLVWDDIIELNYTDAATSGLGFFFNGANYFWKNAKEGKCLSPIITDDKKACISSLHIGGSTKVRADGYSCCFGVTPIQSELIEAKEKLLKVSSVLPMSDMGDFYPDSMGVKVLSRCIKKKSCYLRNETPNSVLFVGSSNNCNRTPKSAVLDTPIKGRVMQLFGVEEVWTAPKFKGPDGHSPYVPWEAGLQNWIVDRPGLPFSLLNRAKTDYTNVLVRVMCENRTYWQNEIKVLSWDETVNGIPGKRFIDSMNFKSSIGFPFAGSKKLFSTNLGSVEGWQDKRVLDPIFIDEAEKIVRLYKQGKRYYPWFTSTLKDEPTLSTKEKVRIFQASSTPFQMVIRKYTLGICRFLQMNPLMSECAVGIDPCSNEWDEMYNHLNGMQTPMYNRWFAIDYKVYDTSISSQMILAIGRIYADLARMAGYTDEDIAVLYSIFTELSFSVIDFNGDVLILDGANPSGNSLTVFINNICNSMLMRIYFYHCYPNLHFSDHARMMGYGDDLIGSIRATVGKFNMRGYAEYLSYFGFKVTPAQKDDILTNYVGVDQVDFLKRKFVWSSDYSSVIAPIEEASIYKRLCNYMSSDTSVEVIQGGNIDGALDEWAFYGRKVYLDRQSKLKVLVEEFDLGRFVNRLHYTYEDRIKLWKKQNADPAVMGKGQGMDTDDSDYDSESSGFFGWGSIIPKNRNGDPPQSYNSGSYSSDESTSINKRTTTNNNKGEVNTNNSLTAEELKNFNWDVIPHSSFSVVSEEIMTMADGSSNQLLEIPNSMDETRKVNDSSDNSLGAFLARPIKIQSFDWTPGTQADFLVLPWSLFLSNKRVVNRIASYKLFRGKMKIKILINGNSFFYGRLMVSYWPLHTLDTMTVNTVDAITNTQFSQMPRVFLDPTLSQGGEMTLPFFWHNDYLDLLGNDRQTMGALVVKQLNGLKHTSGDVTTATRVSVSIYAWMEDVQLEAPTSTNPAYIVPQSTPGDGRSSDTDKIAPYCMPSHIPNSSKTVIKEPHFVEPRGTCSMTLTDVVDTCGKLSLTSKQETTIDPRVLGLGDSDELNIKSMASVESYLTSFNWTQAANREDLLFNMRVEPSLTPSLVVGPNLRLQIPACCGAVLPFLYWNGTFKVRLQFVTSAFHRGRVAIVYDPHQTNLTREDNAAYTHIVDISSCRDVTFKVGPNQDRQLLTYDQPAVVSSALMFGATALANSVNGNGTIAVYCINELALPSAITTVNNSIQVNVFISMDDDFEVFVPHTRHSNYTIVPQSSGVDVVDDIPDEIEESDPYDNPVMSLDQPNAIVSKRNMVYIGEKVTSFRSLLKRYSPWGAFLTPIASGTGPNAIEITHMIFPAYRGGVAGAVHLAAAVPYNFFNQTLLNFLTPAFQAWRGSIRYKFFPRSIQNASRGIGNIMVTQNSDAAYASTNIIYDVSTASKAARSGTFAGNYIQRSKGSLILVQSVNPTVEYEIPWYSDMRFCPGKVSNWTTPTPSRNQPSIGATLLIDNVNFFPGMYDAHVSAGEDFSLYYFTGWPALYYNATIPAA